MQKSILLLSKKIVNYGGNQKTALQIYKELCIEGYDVKIGCILVKSMVKFIDRNDIINFKNCKTAYEETQNPKYLLVIVNKLDNILDYCKDNNDRIIFITHNSMDPINIVLKNTSLITNTGIQNKIRKILTVNQFHISNLYDGKLTCPVTNYHNYNDYGKLYNYGNLDTRDMTRIITYIGRISTEKNVNMLIDSFIKLCENNKKIKLVIIGNGNNNCYIKHEQIIFTDSLDYDGILSWLARSDFLVSTTFTEGLPFSYLEAMSIGIPIITPNIVGCNELIDNTRGILYDYIDYNLYKNNNNWNVFDLIKNNANNLLSITNALNYAFTMNYDIWINLSKNCIDFYNKYYNTNKLIKYNLNAIFQQNTILIITNNIDEFFKKQLPFIDFITDINTKTSDIDKYDIIIKLDNFDILIQKLSLLKTPKMAKINIKNINDYINILYKIRKESIVKNKYELYDEITNIHIYFTKFV
jgi:glycosyltransferase involved in cell wall biosynthesis